MPTRKKDQESVESPKVLELKVAKSVIKVDGTCRVHDVVLPSLELDEKDQMAILHEDELILCTVFADDLVTKGSIKLRGEDMKRLGVNEGTKVLVGSLDDVKKHLKEKKEKEKERKKAEKEAKREKK